ncbi:MAG: Rieske 2Fe-2S domain-containing protein [Bacteroidales bacterium]|nr:Rieske 2Fe-2S domain-containing protein [Bacteroidales bacterium]
MNNLHKTTKLYLFFIISIISILFIKCDKQDYIPNTYVNFNINIDDPLYLDLAVVGNHVFLKNVGVNGLIIYRLGINEFIAYDRTCTYKPEDNCAVVSDENSTVLVKCPCCGSKFSLDYGYATEGKATRPLKKYNTNFDGSFLHVYN